MLNLLPLGYLQLIAASVRHIINVKMPSGKRKKPGQGQPGQKSANSSSNDPKRQKAKSASSASSSASNSAPVHALNVYAESTGSESSSSREQYQEALEEVIRDVEATKQKIARYEQKIEKYETKRMEATTREDEEKYTGYIKEAYNYIAACEAKLARLEGRKDYYLEKLEGSGGGVVTQQRAYPEAKVFLQQLIGVEVQTDSETNERYLELSTLLTDKNGFVPPMNRFEDGCRACVEHKDKCATGQVFQYCNECQPYRENYKDRFVVRECFPDLARQIVNAFPTTECCILSGTPGVGKSAFRNFLIRHIALQFIDSQLGGNYDKLSIALHKGGDDYMVLLVIDRRGQVIRAERKVRKQVYDDMLLEPEWTGGVNLFCLQDLSQGIFQYGEFGTGLIITTSPNDTILKSQYTKQSGAMHGTKVFYLPLLKDTELCCCDPFGTFRDAYDEFGGVARPVWGRKALRDDHRNNLFSDVTDFKQISSSIRNQNAISAIPHRLVYIDVVWSARAGYGDFSKFRLDFGTRELARCVAKQFVSELLQSDNQFGAQLPSVHGWLFESVFLLCIAEKAQDVVFRLKRLTKRCRVPQIVNKNMFRVPTDLQCVKFEDRDLSELIDADSKSATSTLFLPKSSYFPGFDAIMSYPFEQKRVLVLFQVTVSQNHPLSTGGSEWLEVLSSKCDEVFICYCVPDSSRASYTLQTQKGSVSQSQRNVFHRTAQLCISMQVK